jgi:hypothetical protein
MATMTLDDLVTRLRDVWGTTLRAVVLYGSAAGGEHVAKRSDYNVLVLVDTLGVPELQRAAPVARAWHDAGNPPPLTLTSAEWRTSIDTFPMEYADILDRHRVLYGTPPFDGLTVARADLRLQVEREAMGKLIQLRQGILAAGADRARELDLLVAGASAIMVIFRGVLRLMGQTPAASYEELSRQVAERAGFDATPFVRVVKHRRKADRITPEDVGVVLAGYLTGMQRLVQCIDQLDGRA